MKRMKLALFTLGLMAAGAAFAALPASSAPDYVDIPELSGGYTLMGSLIYLNHSPTNGDLNFGSVDSQLHNRFNSKLASVNLGYDPGFGIGIGYIFPGTGNDISLSYHYFDSNSFNFVTPSKTGSITELNDLTLVNSNNIPLSSFSASGEHRLTEIDVTAGQFINVGCRLRLHPLAGLRYTDLQRFYTLSEFAGAILTFPDAESFEIINQSEINQDSNFRGTGPLMGLDASYYLGRGFGVMAHGAGAVLVGGLGPVTHILSVNSVTPLSTGQASIAINSYLFTTRNAARIVPVTDLKLGLDYTYTINNTRDSNLSLEIGYQADEYFNVIDRLATVSNSFAFPNFIIGNTSSDVSFDGPYLTLTYHA